MSKGAPKSYRLFYPRLLQSLSGGYGIKSLRADILAGVTVGLIALPLALALGIASIPPGTPTPYPAPALGLFTAIIAGFLISALGGSRVQIGGPTAAFIPVLLLIVGKYGYTGLLIATVMAGIILILMGCLRMGTLIKFIPWPVTSGFTSGIAVAIMASQATGFLGIRADTAPPNEFLEKLRWLAENLGRCNVTTLGIAIFSILIIIVWPRLGIRRIPGPIIAMIGTTIIVGFFGWNEHFGVETIGSKFGTAAIPQEFPSLHWPGFSIAQIRDLIQPALAIALLGAIESLLSAVVADGLTNDRHDSNTELIAQGMANLICPFFGGLPATGAIARTAANIDNGARSPVAGIIHSLTLLGILFLFARWARYIPVSAMSAVLMVVAWRMGEWHELKRLLRMPRSDAVVLVTTFSLTVIFDLVIAVEIGMVLAAILFIRRVSETTEISRVTENDMLESPAQLAHGKKIPEGVLVYRIFGPFLFGAAEKMEDALEGIGHLPRVLILRLHLVPAMDATALNALESMIERCQRHHTTVLLSGLHRQPLDMLHRSGFIEVIGRENLCGHFDKALSRAREILKAPSTLLEADKAYI